MKAQRFVQALIAAVAVLVGSACVSPVNARDKKEILFVGNSLTYVGNLPAVLDSIQLHGRSQSESDMLVAAGATLTERLRDGSVAKALSKRTYDVVVLQERGGDFACGFGQEVCENSRQSLDQLVGLIRTHGATPILLGTYQGNRDAATAIEDAETRSAAEAKVEYVPIARLLLELRTRHPGMNWFAPDGMHPGSDLTLLEALLLFRQIWGVTPPASAIKVRAPIFTSRAPPFEVLSASSMKGVPGALDGIDYNATRVAILLESIR